MVFWFLQVDLSPDLPPIWILRAFVLGYVSLLLRNFNLQLFDLVNVYFSAIYFHSQFPQLRLHPLTRLTKAAAEETESACKSRTGTGIDQVPRF